jgi:IclR family mhp operon transcriptional activator
MAGCLRVAAPRLTVFRSPAGEGSAFAARHRQDVRCGDNLRGGSESRAIEQAFRTLEALNRYEALCVSEVSRILNVPRTTAGRAIRSLCAAGYAMRREDLRYVPTARVLGLSAGYGHTSRIVDVARPLLDELCRDTGWPVTIAIPAGLSLRIYYTTDAAAPRKIFTSSPGFDLPIRDSASGMVYLAHCDAESRALMLAADDGAAAVAPRLRRSDAQLLADLAAIERDGYFFQDHSFVASREFDGFQEKECLLAVPLLCGGRFVGVLSTRMLTRAVRRSWIETVQLPRLRETARRVCAALDGGTMAVKPAPRRASCPRRPA